MTTEDATRTTIFYSWQSDSDPALNRNFIEDCLGRAAKTLGPQLSLDPALRVDRDTKGVPGTPEITNTILQKIEACDVFVADVTLVAVTEAGARVPNPNVMLEWGYALKARGSEAIVHVMNTAFGEPSDLPFNLIYRRWPISYALISKEERESARPALSRALADAVGASLRFGAESSKRRSGAPLNTQQGIVQTIMSSDPQRDWLRFSDGPHSWATYAHDVSLRLEMDYENKVQNRQYREDWANGFPDFHASGYWCDIVYGASVVMRIFLVSVDGGRLMLPPPVVSADPGDLRVEPLWYKVAEVFDVSGRLYEYFRRAGLWFGPEA